MKSNDIAKNIWLGTLEPHQKTYCLAAEDRQPSTCSSTSYTLMPIKKNEFGTIDCQYYTKKAHQIRSESTGLFFTAVLSYTIVFLGLLFVFALV